MKNRLIILYLRHSLFLKTSIWLQALHNADFENTSVKIAESVIQDLSSHILRILSKIFKNINFRCLKNVVLSMHIIFA